MGLINAFKRNKRNKVSPLSMAEKISFVKVFLQSNDLIPKDFGEVEGDNMNTLVSTPQYTLVMYLDYLYTFIMDDVIKSKDTQNAARVGIDLSDFSLNTESLFKFAKYYTAMRSMPESTRKEIYTIWKEAVDRSDKATFTSLKDASYWWSENIVEPPQIFDLVEGKTKDDLNKNYWDKVEHQLSLNKSLIDAYLDMRGI